VRRLLRARHDDFIRELTGAQGPDPYWMRSFQPSLFSIDAAGAEVLNVNLAGIVAERLRKSFQPWVRQASRCRSPTELKAVCHTYTIPPGGSFYTILDFIRNCAADQHRPAWYGLGMDRPWLHPQWKQMSGGRSRIDRLLTVLGKLHENKSHHASNLTEKDLTDLSKVSREEITDSYLNPLASIFEGMDRALMY